MQLIERINLWLERIETAFIVVILGAMVLLSFFQVVLRNLFDHGILWADIFLRHLVLWVGFIGASIATRREKHINIDLFGRILPFRTLNSVRLITNAVSVVVCYFLADAAYKFVRDEKMYETILFNDVPAWYFQIIIPVGFLLMAVRFLFLSIRNVHDIVRPPVEAD